MRRRDNEVKVEGEGGEKKAFLNARGPPPPILPSSHSLFARPPPPLPPLLPSLITMHAAISRTASVVRGALLAGPARRWWARAGHVAGALRARGEGVQRGKDRRESGGGRAGRRHWKARVGNDSAPPARHGFAPAFASPSPLPGPGRHSPWPLPVSPASAGPVEGAARGAKGQGLSSPDAPFRDPHPLALSPLPSLTKKQAPAWSSAPRARRLPLPSPRLAPSGGRR